jgi:hypothetical protein
MRAYLLLSTTMFVLLGVVWAKHKVHDLLLKLLFVALAIYGIILTLQAYGWVVKP